MHFDQNWAVFIPSFYPRESYEVVIDPRYDAAYWNLHYRGKHIRVDSHTGRALYANAPLVFFHFSGMATERSIGRGVLSPHQSRFTLATFPALKPLFMEYVRRLEALNSTMLRKTLAYGFDFFANGVRIPVWLRETYQRMSRVSNLAFGGTPLHVGAAIPPESDSLKAHLAGGGVQDPFSSSGGGNSVWNWLFQPRGGFLADQCAQHCATNVFVEILKTAGVDCPKSSPWFRHWLRVYGSRILAYAADGSDALLGSGIALTLQYPNVSGTFAGFCKAAFGSQRDERARDALCSRTARGVLLARRWKPGAAPHKRAHFALRAALRVVGDPPAPPGGSSAASIGINVIGYLHGAFGVAHSARLIYHALAQQPDIAVAGVKIPAANQAEFPSLASDIPQPRNLSTASAWLSSTPT